MILKKVTDHFSHLLPGAKTGVTGNRWVTDNENDLLPRNPLFYILFLLKGNRVTDKIEIIDIYNNRVKIGKTGRIASAKRCMRKTCNHLLPVTFAFVGPLRRALS